MPIDPNIVLRGSEIRAQQNQGFLNTLTNAIQSAQERDYRNKMFDYEQQKLANDPQYMAKAALNKKLQGLELDPTEQRYLDFYVADNQKYGFDPITKTPLELPNPLGYLSGRGGNAMFGAAPQQPPAYTPQYMPVDQYGSPPVSREPLAAGTAQFMGQDIPQISEDEMYAQSVSGMPAAGGPSKPQGNAMFSEGIPQVPASFAQVRPRTAQEQEVFQTNLGLLKDSMQKGMETRAYEERKKIDNENRKNEPLNESQGKSATFADRMRQSDIIISSGPEITDAQKSLGNRVANSVPAIGNYMVDENAQKAFQAELDFINAILRRESGAAIGPMEYQRAALQYFPQPGDSPEVIKQKAANRKTSIEGLTREAGPAYQPKANIPEAAIQALASDPSLKDQFEAKYGIGSASGVLGR